MTKTNTVDIGKALVNPDNTYKWLAWMTLVLGYISAFLALGVAIGFNWDNLLTGQFWVDFGTTTLFSYVINWVFSKLGVIMEMATPEYQAMAKRVEVKNKELRDKGLQSEFSTKVNDVNMRIKLDAIRKQVYHKVQKYRHFKRWDKRLEGVLLWELFFEKGDKETHDKANALLNLKAYRIKFDAINVNALNSGFANSRSNGLTLVYNEAYELFWKNSFMKIFSIVMGVMLGVIQTGDVAITRGMFLILMFRIVTYSYNAFFGLINGRSAVKNSKTTVLRNVEQFISTAIEEIEEDKQHGNKSIGITA